jgi:hypothetical protein
MTEKGLLGLFTRASNVGDLIRLGIFFPKTKKLDIKV